MLSPRAELFLRVHGAHMPAWTVERHRGFWESHGRPPEAIELFIAHQRRWGGIVLPPAAEYEGGPTGLDADDPDLDDDGLVFSVGSPRCSMPYSFAVDRAGRFGICGNGYPWVPLHASVAGWVESLALTYAARATASRVRRAHGREAAALIAGLAGTPPIAEVAGLADGWWRSPGALVSVTRGESLLFGPGTGPTVTIYEGALSTAASR